MLIGADWQLMLIDSDWWKLILIEEKNLRAYPWVKIGLKVLLCVKKLTWYSNWHFTTGTQWCQTKYTLSKHQCQNFPKDLLINSLKIWHFFLEKLSLSIREVKEKLWGKSHTSRGEREFFYQNRDNREEKGIFSSKSHKSRGEREIFLKSLEIREVNENLVFKFLKIEKKKRNESSVL